MATNSSPLAIYAAQDQARASGAIQDLGNIPAIAVSAADLAQSIQTSTAIKSRIDASNPIVLLVSSNSSGSALFQSIALYCESQSKRLIIVDLDDVGAANVSGNLASFSGSVVSSCDAGLGDIIDGPDRWTLPSGEPYPETGIKHQKKC